MKRRRLTARSSSITGGTGSLGQTLVRRLLRGELGSAEQDHRVLARRGQAVRDEDRLEARARGHRRHHLLRTSTSCIEFWIGDVRDSESVLTRRRDRGRRHPRRGDEAGARPASTSRPRRSPRTCIGAHEPRRAPCAETSASAHADRRLHRQGLQADQRHGHDQGAPGAHPRRGQPAADRALPDELRPLRQRRSSSRGSVIPLFQHQIASGGPVTITLPEMTRFLLSLEPRGRHDLRRDPRGPAAARSSSRRCPAARITDIAAALIGDRDIEIGRDRHPARREDPRDPGLRGGGVRGPPSAPATT